MINSLKESFTNCFSHESTNKLSSVQMRQSKNGIKVASAALYRLQYTQKGKTQDDVVTVINNDHNNVFSRQAYVGKEENISVDTYKQMFDSVRTIYDTYCSINKAPRLIAVDGTYNNGWNHKDSLNMGFFDITNGIPIDIVSEGNKNKNGEVFCCTEYIRTHLSVFQGNIIVADRAYFSYDFMKFLIDNNIFFILRAKGEAFNLDQKNELSKHTSKFDVISTLRSKIRLVRYHNVMKKTVYGGKGKKERVKYRLKMNNNCVIVTNLTDHNQYSDQKLMDMYRSRWDIEVFFKHVKSNCDFQHVKQKSSTNMTKMYICILIIQYLTKLMIWYYENGGNKLKKEQRRKQRHSKNRTIKINYSLLIKGIYHTLLKELVNGTLNEELMDRFCEINIKLIHNNTGRSFPREALSPFTKWYVKGYSEIAKYENIINAIKTGTIDTLNKNLKLIANQIITINGRKYPKQ